MPQFSPARACQRSPPRAGASKERLGGAAACAVKRTHLDARMAHKARDTGADLREGFEVASVPLFDAATGLWTVTSAEVQPRNRTSALGGHYLCREQREATSPGWWPGGFTPSA